MRNPTIILLVLLGFIQSCSESTAPAGDELGATVSYASGGFGPISNHMVITMEGVVQAERIDRIAGTTHSAPWLQLSNTEIKELALLLEPFSDFDQFYEDPFAPTDGGSIHIALERAGATHEVTIYPADYDAVPIELKTLKTKLTELFAKALANEH